MGVNNQKVDLDFGVSDSIESGEPAVSKTVNMQPATITEYITACKDSTVQFKAEGFEDDSPAKARRRRDDSLPSQDKVFVVDKGVLKVNRDDNTAVRVPLTTLSDITGSKFEDIVGKKQLFEFTTPTVSNHEYRVQYEVERIQGAPIEACPAGL